MQLRPTLQLCCCSVIRRARASATAQTLTQAPSPPYLGEASGGDAEVKSHYSASIVAYLVSLEFSVAPLHICLRSCVPLVARIENWRGRHIYDHLVGGARTLCPILVAHKLVVQREPCHLLLVGIGRRVCFFFPFTRNLMRRICSVLQTWPGCAVG